MTDPVNVNVNDRAEIAALVADYGGNAAYDAWKRIEALLAAAPKAEPVSNAQQLEPLLWSMHILGPDDVYPAPNLATAFKWCEYVNSELAPRTPDVLLVALPVLWDGTAEQHAKSLPDAIKGWTVPAQPEASKVEQAPAPASDELLEVVDMDDFNIIGEWIEGGEKGSAPSGRVKGLWQSMRRVVAIAKHKEPQS